MGRGTDALIVAAGSGVRLGAGGPKALVSVAGRPLFEWSVDACREAGSVGRVIVVAPATHLEEFRREGLTVVAGGSSRSESVSRGLALVDSELVLVHDAARPLVDPGLFDRAVEALTVAPELDAVIAAARVTDTTKRVGPDGRVIDTLDRDQLRAVQTPQVFRARALRNAMTAGDLEAATDDASLIEAAGGAVGVIDAPSGNIKVTVPADLALAEQILSRPDVPDPSPTFRT